MRSLLSEEREKLASMAEQAGCAPVSIRRADDPRCLLALPLPLREDEAHCRSFRTLASENGWEVNEEKGWFLLAKELPPPAAKAVHPSGECASVCSLLLRHRSNEKSADLANRILKGADESPRALEAACEKLHPVLAALLREGKELPDLYGFLSDAIWRYETC